MSDDDKYLSNEEFQKITGFPHPNEVIERIQEVNGEELDPELYGKHVVQVWAHIVMDSNKHTRCAMEVGMANMGEITKQLRRYQEETDGRFLMMFMDLLVPMMIDMFSYSGMHLSPDGIEGAEGWHYPMQMMLLHLTMYASNMAGPHAPGVRVMKGVNWEGPVPAGEYSDEALDDFIRKVLDTMAEGGDLVGYEQGKPNFDITPEMRAGFRAQMSGITAEDVMPLPDEIHVPDSLEGLID